MNLKTAEMMFSKLIEYYSKLGYTGILGIQFEMCEALVVTPNGKVEKLIFNTDDGWH